MGASTPAVLLVAAAADFELGRFQHWSGAESHATSVRLCSNCMATWHFLLVFIVGGGMYVVTVKLYGHAQFVAGDVCTCVPHGIAHESTQLQPSFTACSRWRRSDVESQSP